VFKPSRFIFSSIGVRADNLATEGTRVDLLLDTGAYLSVLSRRTAIDCGFDKLPKITTTLKGYSGGIPADFVRIQGLRVLGKILTGVPVLIPHDVNYTDPVTKLTKPFQEILGLNVLEYFNYFVNTENDRLYLNWNPTPRPYSKEFACGQSFLLNANENISLSDQDQTILRFINVTGGMHPDEDSDDTWATDPDFQVTEAVLQSLESKGYITKHGNGYKLIK